MRHAVADLGWRVEIGLAANDRYLMLVIDREMCESREPDAEDGWQIGLVECPPVGGGGRLGFPNATQGVWGPPALQRRNILFFSARFSTPQRRKEEQEQVAERNEKRAKEKKGVKTPSGVLGSSLIPLPARESDKLRGSRHGHGLDGQLHVPR